MNAGGRFTAAATNGMVIAGCTSFANCVDRQISGSESLLLCCPFRSKRCGHGTAGDERSRYASCSGLLPRSRITNSSKSCCHSTSWPTSSVCISERSRPQLEPADSRHTSAYDPPSAVRFAPPRVPLESGSSLATIDALVVRRFVRYLCRPFPTTMTNASTCPSTLAPDPGGVGAADWGCREGGRVSVGVEKADAFTGSMATSSQM